MLLRYLYDPNLAQASYLVGCQRTGEALVVDPNRETEQYIELAGREGLRITAVTETHIHADYLSGARELAARTGATLYLSDEGGPDWCYRFEHEGLRDGDLFMVGNLRVKAIHTPGHTPEHLSFLLTDTVNADEPMGIFTGDFLFVGDIGRPDLLEAAAGQAASKEPSARTLFHSLQKLRELSDWLQVWPGHGAGSACGKALGAVPSTTLGYERRFNWAFRVTDEEEFVRQVLEGQPEPPRYFAQMKRINRDGPPLRDGLPEPRVLTVERLRGLLEDGAIVVDTRPWDAYAKGHVPGTLGIALDSSFATYAGTLLPYDRPLYLIVDEAEQERALTELGRIGLDDVRGVWRTEVVNQWPGSLSRIREVSAEAFAERLSANGITALDVRRSTEYEDGHIPGVPNLPLQKLVDQLETVPRNAPLYVHCQSGKRSGLAASLLQSLGWEDVTNVRGGFAAWEEAGLPTTNG
ncbi:MAG TPA: rhodanese-like domain-containing protein [Ardenticatenaceae bacterium]|jgi:hydroxyacylglutathione hydrolase